jgi:hypothetical protein
MLLLCQLPSTRALTAVDIIVRAAMRAAAVKQLASYQHVYFGLGHAVYINGKLFDINIVVALWLLCGQVIII